MIYDFSSSIWKKVFYQNIIPFLGGKRVLNTYCKPSTVWRFIAEVTDSTKEQQHVETKTDSSDEEEVIPDRRNKYRLDNIKLDVKGLMKSAKPTVRKAPHTRKTDPSPARSDHTHAKQEEQLLTPVSKEKKQTLKKPTTKKPNTTNTEANNGFTSVT